MVDRNFSGAIAVALNGKLTFSTAHGYADREARRLNTVETRFGLASTGKLLTSIAVMQLVETGQLNLDEPVGKYMPDYVDVTIREQATIRHLMKMQSGLGDIFTDEYDLQKRDLKTHADYLRLFERQPPAFPPGSDRAYSNAGYILLGRIIELVSGEDYYSYVRNHIFVPAGMEASGFSRDEPHSEPQAIGYRVEGLDGIAESPDQLAGRDLIANTNMFADRGTAAGGGFSTVLDFVKLDKALRNNVLISSRSLEQIFGKGFVSRTRGAGIAGGAPGASTRYRLLPNGYSMVAFGNLDLPSAPEIVSLIENSIDERDN
ncbi:serine hydrolase domain-containing protein [Parasphingorhabdus marina]|uniref:serine hydrolase domain-containing protein n=1 Tax=Parasphingorhabdus marina TaxID=394732 RepID=UPI0013566723|nr:serine hydrolase domain-containing protein [Parasphingorhabdus marina]